MGPDQSEERLLAIAYNALWQLFENDPVGEPAHFKMTRLDLHRSLEVDGDLLVPSSAESEALVPERPELRLVP